MAGAGGHCKRYGAGIINLENRDKKWADIFSAAMFIGMISAFLGYVFADFSTIFHGDPSGLMPVVRHGGVRRPDVLRRTNGEKIQMALDRRLRPAHKPDRGHGLGHTHNRVGCPEEVRI